jgi:hypothetical protein
VKYGQLLLLVLAADGLGCDFGQNIAVAQNGNLKPAKDKSTERIDGIVALIMAIGRALLPQQRFVDEPFLLVLW